MHGMIHMIKGFFVRSDSGDERVGDEAYETLHRMGWRPAKGHAEQVDGSQFKWVEDKPEAFANPVDNPIKK